MFRYDAQLATGILGPEGAEQQPLSLWAPPAAIRVHQSTPQVYQDANWLDTYSNLAWSGSNHQTAPNAPQYRHSDSFYPEAAGTIDTLMAVQSANQWISAQDPFFPWPSDPNRVDFDPALDRAFTTASASNCHGFFENNVGFMPFRNRLAQSAIEQYPNPFGSGALTAPTQNQPPLAMWAAAGCTQSLDPVIPLSGNVSATQVGPLNIDPGLQYYDPLDDSRPQPVMTPSWQSLIPVESTVASHVEPVGGAEAEILYEAVQHASSLAGPGMHLSHPSFRHLPNDPENPRPNTSNNIWPRQGKVMTMPGAEHSWTQCTLGEGRPVTEGPSQSTIPSSNNENGQETQEILLYKKKSAAQNNDSDASHDTNFLPKLMSRHMLVFTAGSSAAQHPQNVRVRQAFQNPKRRKETGETRKIGACVRCHMQKIRVSLEAPCIVLKMRSP